ncbi:integrase catalytic domain-containing protein [Trichonephila clavipes]|nr:integrase catalytic domain-containing protein [Trichonephila clavipes]
MQFWPINGKGIARKTVHDCIACFRQKPTGVDQLMGNLPSERVTPKAVTDLTTEAFIAALKRLCARRGRISTLMSDNATNFKGAAAELNRFIKLICNKNETLANYFASEAIQWKFIPPRSNFGGLWEAGVKSFKHHLYRTLVNSKITFEEFETIIIQIEGILNSRPLVPLSDNINENEVLTPGHFIIGLPISAIPEPAILDISDNRLSRWQYATNCVQTIWKRWKNDYLNHLQQRNKWQFEKNNVAVGCLVLLKENDLPPCKWAMARILEVIYGTDERFNSINKKLKTPGLDICGGNKLIMSLKTFISNVRHESDQKLKENQDAAKKLSPRVGKEYSDLYKRRVISKFSDKSTEKAVYGTEKFKRDTLIFGNSVRDYDEEESNDEEYNSKYDFSTEIDPDLEE